VPKQESGVIHQSGQRLCELSFQKSQWSTCGWTLQELLAPASVEFFNEEGEKLADKVSLERPIYATAGIPVLVLQLSPLSQFSITEKIS
jgi:hypothetical protein